MTTPPSDQPAPQESSKGDGLLCRMSRLLARRWRLLLACLLIAGILAIAVLFVMPLRGLDPTGVARFRANQALDGAGIPHIPASARRIYMTSYAFLASEYLLVRFDASGDEIEAFLTHLQCKKTRNIGSGEGCIRLVTRQEYGRELDNILGQYRLSGGDAPSPMEAIENSIHKPNFQGVYSWWTPEKIRSGKVGLEPKRSYGVYAVVYYDDEQGRVYVEWDGS